jgi:4-hydroxybenzoate polyprenyltransferase
MRALLEAVRPRQWIKNLFVAAPLVFSKHLGDPRDLARALAAVAIFCGLSSAVYLWNDLVDVEKDRAHPRKCKRPIADGRLPIPTAKVAAATLAAGGLALGSVLDSTFALLAAGYLLLNVAYSLYLKRIVYVDVLCLSTGFILRVLAGGYAIDVYVTRYLLLCTALLACFLGFGKRAHELASSGARAIEQRPVLRGYRAGVLRWALFATGVCTFASYVLYTRAPHTIRFFGTTRMVWTAPFAAIGLGRFWWLVNGETTADSPTEEMLKDVPFVVNLLVWAAAVMVIIYFRQ